MTATLFFPDNTVLVNFALTGRFELLKRLANGNGAWCATVAQECANSARVAGLEELGVAPAIFGPPLSPTPAELVNIYVLRDQMVGPGDSRSAHLGEAETITIMTTRHLGGFFVTDDKTAGRVAAAAGITVIDTWYLIKTAVRIGELSVAEAWSDAELLSREGRGRPPCPNGKAAFETWLSA